jgi:hypothetical protein
MSGRVTVGALVLTALAMSACGGGGGSTARSSTTTSTTPPSPTPTTRSSSTSSSAPTTPPAPAPVQTLVRVCPVPSADYTGTPFRLSAPPLRITLPAGLAPPAGARLFGSVVAGETAYLIAPSAATCEGAYARADAGITVTATVGARMARGVDLVVRAGGANAYASLACPYVAAVQSVEVTLPGTATVCTRSPTDVVQQLDTAAANVDAAAVFVPGGTEENGLPMSGHGDPTLALFTARMAGPQGFDGQMIACTLPPAERDVCSASLELFLVVQSGVNAEVATTTLAQMEHTVAAFVDEH